MFTGQEKKNITTLLSKAVNPNEALTLEELHGFLFGLAITPMMIKPSEWLPVVFGDKMMEFESEAEASELMGHLFMVCNRFYAENHKGKLVFPFDMRALKKGDISRIRDWTYSLYLAMSLRPDVWTISGSKDRGEDEQELTTSCGIIISIAKPEHIPEIFEKRILTLQPITTTLSLMRLFLRYCLLP